MTEHFWLGLIVIVISAVANGIFAFPMKFTRIWKWENTWLAFAFVFLVIPPWLLALFFVPHLGRVYASVPLRTLSYPIVFGFIWGFAETTVGLCFETVGVGLTFCIVLSLNSLCGSFIPLLVLHPHDLLQPRGIVLIVSTPILLLGLILSGMAGMSREKEQAHSVPAKERPPRSFLVGLVLCIFTGIVGANFNLGFAFSGDIIRKGMELGASTVTATYAVWALILPAAFIPILAYCGFLLFRHHTWSLFVQKGSGRDALMGTSMGVLALIAFVVYGIGATLIGKYGTSLGFALFMALTILISNLFGLLTGEWRGTSKRTKAVLAGSVAVVLISIVVLSMAGTF